MKLSIQSFKGISPKTNPRYLAEGAAQIALNVEAFGQSLKPLKGLSSSLLTLAKSGVLRTLYRFGQDYAGEDKYWFHWAADVDVCRSQIAGDVSEWTFYTGDGWPKATYNALALAGTSTAYPVTSRRLGLPAPTTALTATVVNPTPETEPATVTLTEAARKQVTSSYGIKVSTSTDDGATWNTNTAAIAATAAPSVTMTTAQVAAVTADYGVYVSVDGGQTRTHCPITAPTSATAPSVTLNATHIASMMGNTAIRVSVDGGLTYRYGSVGTTLETATAATVAAAINRIAGAEVNAVVSGTSVIVTALNKGADVKLRLVFDSTTLSAAGSGGSSVDQAAAITSSINTNAGSLVTATTATGQVTVTAKTSGATVKLRVAWGTSASQAVEATGSSTEPATVATAINNLDHVVAEVDGTSVVVTSDASGNTVSLKVQWGDEIGRTLTAKGTTQDLGTKETRVYTYTYISEESGLTVESAPWSADDMASATVDVYPGTGKEMCLLDGVYKDGYTAESCKTAGGTWEASKSLVTLTGFAAPPSADGWYYTGMRIYRATAGVFLFVDEVGKVTSYKDTKSASALGEPCPSTTWSPPPADLAGLINLPNGMMAGFKGRDVAFCVPFRPYAWPDEYGQTVDYPVVGLGRMDTTLAVLTTGTPYLIQGASPEYATVVKSDLEQACVSKRSIVSMGGAVVYASPDGLLLLSSGGSKILTGDIFDRADWQALNPASIHAYGHDSKYVAFHNPATIDGVTYTGFVVDLKSQQFIRHNISGVTAGYADLRNDQLYLVDGSKQVVKWEGGGYLTGRWRSKVFSLPQISGFVCAQVEAENYTGVKCALYRDGVKVTTELTAVGDAPGATAGPRLHGRYPFRLEPKQGRDWEIDMTVTQEIFNVVVAQAMAEIGTA